MYLYINTHLLFPYFLLTQSPQFFIMNKKDIFLYTVGISIFIFISILTLKSINKLESEISSRIELKSNSPQIEQAILRYDYMSKALLSNSSRKNIAFLVGSMMIILGTILIISKIESSVNANIDTLEKAKFQIRTSSPGIFIVFLGTIIIITVVLKGNSYSINDSPIKTTVEETVTKTQPKKDTVKVKDLIQKN